jgi:hypothetical protein
VNVRVTPSMTMVSDRAAVIQQRLRMRARRAARVDLVGIVI